MGEILQLVAGEATAEKFGGEMLRLRLNAQESLEEIEQFGLEKDIDLSGLTSCPILIAK